MNDVVSVLAIRHWLLWTLVNFFGLMSRHFRSIIPKGHNLN